MRELNRYIRECHQYPCKRQVIEELFDCLQPAHLDGMCATTATCSCPLCIQQIARDELLLHTSAHHTLISFGGIMYVSNKLSATFPVEISHSPGVLAYSCVAEGSSILLSNRFRKTNSQHCIVSPVSIVTLALGFLPIARK